MKMGLYADIAAKKARIKAGSGERCASPEQRVRLLRQRLRLLRKLQRVKNEETNYGRQESGQGHGRDKRGKLHAGVNPKGPAKAPLG